MRTNDPIGAPSGANAMLIESPIPATRKRIRDLIMEGKVKDSGNNRAVSRPADAPL